MNWITLKIKKKRSKANYFFYWSRLNIYKIKTVSNSNIIKITKGKLMEIISTLEVNDNNRIWFCYTLNRNKEK